MSNKELNTEMENVVEVVEEQVEVTEGKVKGFVKKTGKFIKDNKTKIAVTAGIATVGVILYKREVSRLEPIIEEMVEEAIEG